MNALRILQRRAFHTSRLVAKEVPAAAAAAAPPAEKKEVGPDNFEIAPTTIPWKNFKNEHYEKRGYKLAPKEWSEWSDLPAPYKYLGVKMNPADVQNAGGAAFKMMSDWRIAVPAAILMSLPFWMFNVLPPLDERLELALITTAAGWMVVQQAGPFFKEFKRERVEAKVKALLGHEKELNEEISSSMEAFKAGSSVVDYIKTVNAAERSLRGLEAAAASRKVVNAQRDALVEQLNYLVSLQASGAADNEAAVSKAARSAVEAALEKDAALQQRSIDGAIKALKEGSLGEDVVSPLYAAAADNARAELAAGAGAKQNPFKDAQQADIFKKRFGYVEEAVSEGTLQRAQSDASAMAVLIGKLGGAAPKVGAAYKVKAPIAYAK